MAKSRADNVEAFFDALEALTYNEMRNVASLLHLQTEGRGELDEAKVAEALADTADSYRAAQEDEE